MVANSVVPMVKPPIASASSAGPAPRRRPASRGSGASDGGAVGVASVMGVLVRRSGGSGERLGSRCRIDSSPVGDIGDEKKGRRPV